MDPLNSFPPLFEAKLELNVTKLIFVPSIEKNIEGNFINLIESIIENIMHVTTLISKIYVENESYNYRVSTLKN